MINVLITGSHGFIGKNLINKLQHKNVNILEFNRSNTIDELKELILKSDFIYHLAGEVRPKSSDKEFKESNVTLTKIIVDILIENNKYIPIVLASSVHAQLLKNEYGRTKRESEILIENYSKKDDTNCYIYRLPHVFGEGCKINYNSVISTWIYNSIKELEINIYDRDIKMNYVYVQDIVDEFVEKLEIINNSLYQKPKNVFDTTLGESIDYIVEFKNNINNINYKIVNNEFKAKLFETYKDYYINLKEKDEE